MLTQQNIIVGSLARYFVLNSVRAINQNHFPSLIKSQTSQHAISIIATVITQSNDYMMASNSRGRQSGWTNQVLQYVRPEETIYFLPCYLRFKLKYFVSVSIATQQAVVNGDLIIGFHYSKLPSFIVEALKSNVILHFNRNESVRLCKSSDIGLKNSKQSISFTLRRDFTVGIDSKYFLWPFEMLRLLLVITVRSLLVGNPLNLGRPILLRFNCMDHPDKRLKFSYNDKLSIGSYCLAPKKISIFYSRQPIFDLSQYQFQQQQDQELNELSSDRGQTLQTMHEHRLIDQVKGIIGLGYYQYGHFMLGVYHYPFATLFGLLLPMWSLALYNLMIYFQGNDLSMRISNSVFIDLSLLDYIPTIRSQLPGTPNLLLIEVLLYSLAVTFHLTIIDSYLVYQTPDYQMNWKTNILFIISLVISLMTVVIVLALSLIHKFCWERDYIQEESEDKPFGFNRNQWANKECDQHFSRFPEVRPLK